jgi:hypothetical protein
MNVIPENKFAVNYLQARGIDLEKALSLGVEITTRETAPRGIWHTRLKFDHWHNGKLLPDIIDEAIWISCADGARTIQSYSARVFPEPKDKEGKAVKFLSTKDSGGYPFIPPATWEVAAKSSHSLCLVEGPVKALSVLQAGGLPIGLGGVWMAARMDENFRTDLVPVLRDNFEWRSRRLHVIFDADSTTNLAVKQALLRTAIVFWAYGTEAKILQWPLNQGKGIDDFLAAKIGGEIAPSKIFELLCDEAVPLAQILGPVDLERVELELFHSRLTGVLLEQLCRMTAKPLNIGVATLRNEIIEARRKQAVAVAVKPPPNVVPRALPEILASIVEILNRYVVFPFPDEQATVVALWVVHTWLFAAFDFTPYLFIYSPAVRSGKTRFFEVLEMICRNTVLCEGATSAALLRIIGEAVPPTFLLDEMDVLYSRKSRGGNSGEAENMRGFLNAGFKRGAKFLRCAFKGKEIFTQELPAYSPKAMAAVTRCLPHSVSDRSVPIAIERQGKKKKAARLRGRDYPKSVEPLRDELEVLSLDQELLEALSNARPAMPDELHDRQQDICEPLLAIADHAGDWKTTDPETGKEKVVKWPEEAREALRKVFGQQEEDQDTGIRLLNDIKQIFDTTKESALFTGKLLLKLIGISDDAPWSEWFEADLKQDKPQSAASRLARCLKPHNIKPKSIRKEKIIGKGYSRDQFEKAWERYLTPEKK